MKSKRRRHPRRPRRKRPSDLDRRYGNIGISAVAAALRYRERRQEPAYAPVVHRIDERFGRSRWPA